MNLFLATTIERLAPELELLAGGRHGDPGRVLGCRRRGARGVVAACLPGAIRARLHRRREALNSDSAHYGGSNLGNLGHIAAQRDPALGRAHSAGVGLAPLAALVLVPG